jgi:GT2 family glycosyltransferase
VTLGALRAAARRHPWMKRALLRLAGPLFPVLRLALGRAESTSYHTWFARWQSSGPADDAAIAAAAGTAPHLLVLVADDAAGARTRASLAAQVGAAAEAAGPAEADAALQRAATSGGYVMRLEAGELLARHALAVVSIAVRGALTRPLIIVADEDVRDADGRHRDPWFKTVFYLERLLQQDSFGRAVAYDAGLLMRHRVATLRGHALALAAARAALAEAGPGAILHVPAVLLHRDPADACAPWRSGTDPTAVAAALAEAGEAAVVRDPLARPLRITWQLPDPAPMVSVIVPTRDRADLMRTCLDGLLRRTDYPALDVIVVDNGSTEPALQALLAGWTADGRLRVLPAPGPFNYAALNNRAAVVARGDIILLLNNDTEVLHPDWLTEMARLALRPGIGAVGARLLFPDSRVQHAGVVLGVGGVAAHDFLFAARADPGSQDALRLLRAVSAVTAACLAVRRDAYLAVGGMDEERFAVAYNDVDLCLKLRRAGLVNLVTPHAELLHHESASRGSDETPARRARWQAEHAAMRASWGRMLDADPFLSPAFSRADAFRRLAEPPGRLLPWRRG